MKTEMTYPERQEARKKLMAELPMDELMDHWLKDGKPLTADQVCKVLGISRHKWARVLEVFYGAPDGWSYTKVEKEKRSRDYPMMVVGHCQVSAWEPSKEGLRRYINRLLGTL